MVKNINIAVDDDQYRDLNVFKAMLGLTWREFLVDWVLGLFYLWTEHRDKEIEDVLLEYMQSQTKMSKEEALAEVKRTMAYWKGKTD